VRYRIFVLATALVALIFALGDAVSLAAASAPATIHTCRAAGTGALYLWDSCPRGYTGYSWAVTGPAGARGAAGPQGVAGPSFTRPFTLLIAVTATGPYVQYTCSTILAGGAGDITQVTCGSPTGVLAHR
jgi:hypothetical protein